MTASKYGEDCSYNNVYFSRVGGLSVAELNSLELSFLLLLDFDLNVLPETYDRYERELLKHRTLAPFEKPLPKTPHPAEATVSSPAASGKPLGLPLTLPMLRLICEHLVEEEVRRKRLPQELIARASELVSEQ